jgi:thiosulfate/3-mercaptopyruvate sulfurtransferase
MAAPQSASLVTADWVAAYRMTRPSACWRSWSKLLGAAGVGEDTRLALYGDNNNWFAAFRFLAGPHLRPPRRGADRRRPQEMGGRRMAAGQRAAELRAHQLPDTTGRSPLPRRSARRPAAGWRQSERHGTGRRAVAGRIQRRGAGSAGARRNCATGRADSWRAERPLGADGGRRRYLQGGRGLRQLYAARAIVPENSVISYCRIGERSAHTWFVLHELHGYPGLRNYDGSRTEYGSVIGVPIDNPSGPAR